MSLVRLRNGEVGVGGWDSLCKGFMVGSNMVYLRICCKISKVRV